MLFSKLAIAITDKCSAACSMCCFSCSPSGTQHLETDLIKSVIDEMAETKTMRSIGWTGGEAFLYYDQIKECTIYAKSKGFRLTINTNGYWGKDEKRAREMIKELKQIGIEVVSFSADRYHQKFVPIEDLRTALRVCNEEKMLTDISFMDTTDSDDIVKLTEALRPEIYQTLIQPHPLLPVGRAMKTIKKDQIVTGFKTENAKCSFNGLIHLNFDGYYYLCCSQFCKEIPPLKIGKAGVTPFAELEKKVSSNPYLYIMLTNGFHWYIEKAKEYNIEIPDYLCSSCHCCYFVFRNMDFLRQIRDDVEKEFERLRLQKLFD
ncbi:MAG: radical SAM protein [Treponema sp.]|nr:radical SAM protein [Treponema sp.]